MCVCEFKDNQGLTVMKMEQGKALDGEIVTVMLGMLRKSRWEAEIFGQTMLTKDEGMGCQEKITYLKVNINYCPICGKRLSLGDASRRENT